MREIKFRARNANVPPCWIYGYFVKEHGICRIINDAGSFPVIAGTEGQFTGLKDKNGKEIYEGDVVRHNDYSRGACLTFEQYKKISVIEWSEGAIPYKIKGLGFDYHGTDLEVIGNIYENPDLIKGA
jgi:hypothetical protein